MSSQSNNAKLYTYNLRQFIQKCQSIWPDNTTTPEDIRDVFLTAANIEQLVNQLQENSLFESVLTKLYTSKNVSKFDVQNCLADPPKVILKKIIQSDITHFLLIGFTQFIEIFSKQKLEEALAEVMVESASIDTLVKHITTVVPKECLQESMTQLFVTELASCDVKHLSKEIKSCSQEQINMLIKCLLKGEEIINVTNIELALERVMSCKDTTVQKFWGYIFKVEDQQFVQFCLKYHNFFYLICKTLGDCLKLQKENMSSESFYVNLKLPALKEAIQKTWSDNTLKSNFALNLPDVDMVSIARLLS